MQNYKNAIIGILLTIILFLVMLLCTVIHYKDIINKNKFEISTGGTHTNTNIASTTIHPFNHCMKIVIQHSAEKNNTITVQDAAKYCEPLLVDRKEYKEHKQYHNSSKK